MDREVKDYTELLQKFYDHGFLREVYRSEKTIVCNVYNQFYMVFDRKFLEKFGEKYKDMIPGFVMNSKGLREIVKDDSFAKRYYMLLSEEEQSKTLRFLDEVLFQSFIRRDEKLRSKPVPESMDLEFEKELLEKGPEAVKAQLMETEPVEAKPRKRGFFGLFK